MILVSFYAVFSAIAVAVPLIHHHWVTAFCVAVLCAAAYAAGEAIRDCFRGRRFTRTLGRLLTAGILIALVLYLSHYRINMVVASVPGLFWAALGVVVGILANTRLLKR